MYMEARHDQERAVGRCELVRLDDIPMGGHKIPVGLEAISA